MSFKDSKVAIIGCGNVGATIGYTLINQGLCESIALIDQNKEKALGDALDMQHAVYFMNRNIKVEATDYSACSDADIIVITASAPMAKDSHDRLAWVESSKKIMDSIVGEVMKTGFDGTFIVVSNPVDIMAYYVWKISGLPRNHVIGSGTTLDTARLCVEISHLFDLDSKSVEAFVIGEHGDSEVVSWRSATIGGKNLSDVMEDNKDRAKEESFEDLRKKTVEAGWQIFNRKGNTSYGIAASTCALIKSILFNENRIYPVSVCLNGQYGLSNIFLSVPTILDKTGAKEIVEIKLADEELEGLKKSAEVISSFYKDLNI